MDKYYYNFIIKKLKNDIIKQLNQGVNYEEIIKKEIDHYFNNNTITFDESDKTTGTHQVRNRDAYEKKQHKCKAFVWNEGHGGQCSRSIKEGCNGFCKTHFKKGGEDWFLGTVEKRVERPIDEKGKKYIWLEHR
jgi:hypothetical protein